MLPDHRRWSDLEDTRAALAHPTMEAAETGARQSGILSLINQDRNSKESYDRAYTTSMAAAAVISPTTSMYSNGPPPPYSSGWPAPPPSHALSGLLSPPESRRTSDNKNEPPSLQTQAPHRQSLPSIHEALNSGPKPTPSYVSPITSHPPQQPQQHQQSPYTQGPPIPPRSYPEPATYSQAPPQPRHASPPHPIHPQNPFSRPEPIPASYPENRHASSASLQAAPAPPHNPYAAPPPQAPRFDAPRYEQDSRPQERVQPNGYSSHPPQEPYGYALSSQRDSGYPPSHTPHAGMHDQSRYPPRDDRQSGEWSRGGMDEKRNAPFVVNMKRHLDIWDFENNLSQIHTCSNKIRDWSAHYELIAQEQQRTVTYPERMPNMDDCNEMLAQNKKIHDALQWMRETICQQEHAAMADQRMREQGGKDYEVDEMSMYGDDLKTQGFGGSESKKRRGRAAPPGRCHSCNRAETPEWRRGPDGARTLCNACGLHYAKLTRKNHSKQLQGSNCTSSKLRPKSMDDRSPRPL